MTAISYELAKELERAGWPQPELTGDNQNNWAYDWIDDPRGIDRPTEVKAYSPTLSELIAACGIDFENLHRRPFGNISPEDEISFVCNFNEEDSFGNDPEGSTPEEAVARLWLKLQEKT